MEYLSDNMTDVVTPKYKERVAHGEIINNPMSHVITHRWTDGAYHYHAKHKTQNLEYYGVGGSLTQAQGGVHKTLPSSLINTALASAQTSAIANMDKTPASMLEDVLEIRSSLSLLRNPVKSVIGETYKIGKLYKQNMHRVHKRSVKERLDNAYLAYRFAIGPMIRSIDTLINIDMLKAKNEEKYGPKAFNRRRSTGSAIIPLYTASDTYGTELVFQRHVLLEGSVRATILYEVNNPVDDWRRTYGLRNKDIPKGLWAIVPMSFMVDRVYNASKQIGALSNLADPKIRILAGSYTVRSQANRSVQLIKHVSSLYWITCSGDTVYESIDSKTRTVWTPSAFDTFQGFTPEELVKDATSTSDLLALAAQRLKGFAALRRSVIQKR
jgi:hypothetical protein